MPWRFALRGLILSCLLFGVAACYHPPIQGDWGYHFREMREGYGMDGEWSEYDSAWRRDQFADMALPEIHPGKFNVAFIYVGEIDDNEWNAAHEKGRRQVEAEVEGVRAAYLESVPDGSTGAWILRSLLERGFDAIIATTFDYEDSLLELATEYPDRFFVNVTGHLRNDTNMATLSGAMENANYLAGMAAGARASADGSHRVGYVGSQPFAEMVRLANATALGMRRTCPNCMMELTWKYAWAAPELEQEIVQDLLDDGATVLVAGSDNLIPLLAAQEWNLHAIPRNLAESCEFASEACLGVPYWNWGPFYVAKVRSMMDGAFEAGDFYHDFTSGIAGFHGFMEGQTPQPGIPEDAVSEIRAVLAEMQSGEFDRFDIFTGPINDNQGHEIVPAGVVLTQSDLEGIDAYMGEMLNRPSCVYCMDWLVEGFVPGSEASD